MGLGFTLFVKPLLVIALAGAALLGVYLLPEVWPDHAAAVAAIRDDDIDGLRRFIERGLDPNTRSQWRSFPRRLLDRTSREGVGDDTPDLAAAGTSLLVYSLSTCRAVAARQLVQAGAALNDRAPDGSSPLERAATCDAATLVDDMLARGADANAPSPDGGTVLWEPTSLGWRRRPYAEAIVSALERAGARQPQGSPVRRW